MHYLFIKRFLSGGYAINSGFIAIFAQHGEGKDNLGMAIFDKVRPSGTSEYVNSNMRINETNPAVSIIVPVYNAEKFLRECIESVLAQSFTNWEVLLVNDGSTDGSGEICRHYSELDKRIKLITKPNGGLSSARNAGLDKAVGKYVFFLDSDDELYPHSISCLYDIAENYNVALVAGRYARMVTKPDSMRATGNVRLVDSRDLCMMILYRRGDVDNSACAKLYRRSLFDGLRFYKGWYEDLEIFHKVMLRADNVGITDGLVYFYRDNPSSFINKWSEGRRDAVKVTREIVGYYADDPVLKKASLNRYFRANYNLLLMLLRHRPDDMEAINDCFANVKSLRRTVLTDPHSRFTTRAGALLSYLGLGFIRRLAGK